MEAGKMIWLLLLVLCLALGGTRCWEHGVDIRQDLTLVLNASQYGAPFKHFWQSTGFCPPEPHQASAEFDLSADMVQNLAYIGAVPHHGIQQVRIHWLLDLVKVQGFSSGWPVYNFTYLDQLVGLLHQNGLQPGFEIMGSPSGIFTDMENKTQVYWWRDLVTQVAQRYIDQYGLDYVREWNFETWNEPDCHDFDEVKMTVQGFLNYYDACSEGLKAASPQLVFGGPGDGCDSVLRSGNNSRLKMFRGSEFANALFGHVVNGTNYFTGETGVRMDFISLHKKGEGKASHILSTELEAMDDIKAHYPSLAQTPFYNDEADPLVGWNKDEHWRATATYAAVAVKVISQHQNMLLASGHSPMNYSLLSNDNGFLSFYPHQFTQRTLVARFQMNSTDHRYRYHNNSNRPESSVGKRHLGKSSSHEKYVTFVRKPIYAAMSLLAKLGDQQVPAVLLDKQFQKPLPNDSYAGVLATVHEPVDASSSDSWQMAALFYSSSDTDKGTVGGELSTQWYIDPANTSADLVLAMYAIRDGVSDPYQVWDKYYQKPDFPTLRQFAVMRENEGPYRFLLMTVPAKPGYISVPDLAVHEPDVHLLHLCEKSPLPPEQVTDVRLINITAGQVLVRWSDVNIKTKCIKTFEVELSNAGSSGPYYKITTDDSIVNIFVFATDSEANMTGYFRVRAVDYWQRPGEYSGPVLYGTNNRGQQ